MINVASTFWPLTARYCFLLFKTILLLLLLILLFLFNVASTARSLATTAPLDMCVVVYVFEIFQYSLYVIPRSQIYVCVDSVFLSLGFCGVAFVQYVSYCYCNECRWVVQFFWFCVRVSLVWQVPRCVIIIPSFLLLKFGVCWWKSYFCVVGCKTIISYGRC